MTDTKFGDALYVLQILGGCIGNTVREVRSSCVAPPLGHDPAGLNLFPVGQDEYANPTGVNVDGTHYSVKGTVYYPAEDDGKGRPFNDRLARPGAVPVVFMAHGNHYTFYDPSDRNNEACGNPGGWIEIPNHEGYDYFQRRLARMGIVAVSVYSNETNCKSYSATNMRRRAEVIIASIAHFQSLAADPASIFHNRIDFARVGLMGHSRGGEAVVVVPEIIALPGVTIAAVLSLAPTDAGASSGAPKRHAFMTLLPAGDGDVVGNDGAKFYDQASPDAFKCQLYVHYTNHNFFNRQWPADESKGPPVLSRHAHERVLLAYGCAFYRAVLLGHPTLPFLNGKLRPPGVAYEHVHLSFELATSLTVDHHEDGNTIAKNSLEAPTQQLMGLSADEYAFSQAGTPRFNDSFFGNTIGMVARSTKPAGEFRSELDAVRDLGKRAVWIRSAEVYNGRSVPAAAAGFELGLEAQSGVVGWVDSDQVGGLPGPYDRRADDLASWYQRDLTKTMLKTLRFPAHCFAATNRELDLANIKAIRLRLNRGGDTALAFDVLQIV